MPQSGIPSDPTPANDQRDALELDEGALPAVLTVDELAELLRVERKSAYAAISRGEIPGVRRLGRAIRISREAVLEWLRNGQGRVSRSRRSA